MDRVEDIPVVIVIGKDTKTVFVDRAPIRYLEGIAILALVKAGYEICGANIDDYLKRTRILSTVPFKIELLDQPPAA